MTFSDLAAFGSFLSGCGVIASMIYAAIELRRHRRELEMNAAHQAEIEWSDFNVEMADPVFSQMVFRSMQPAARLEDFSPAEQAQLSFVYRAFFHRVQAQWYLRDSRGLPAEVWQKTRLWCRTAIESPLVGALWNAEKGFGNFTDDFVRDVEMSAARSTLPLAVLNASAGASA